MQNILSNFGDNLTVAVIGATGGIGNAFIEALSTEENVDKIYIYSRTQPETIHAKAQWAKMDITNEHSIENALSSLEDIKFDIVINATGRLSVGNNSPERNLRDIDLENFETIFAVNAHAPALLMKHFLPLLNKESKSVFASLSARVGSISDNQLGGWYAYRASKAALNMLIKTASIEVARRNKTACVIGLHPGTVDTQLSQPFKTNVPEGKLFTPNFSAESMLSVINKIDADQTGRCFDFDGKEVAA